MRRLVKPIAEALLGGKSAFGRITAWKKPIALVLAFHNVLPDRTESRGDRSLHLPLSTFCEFIDWLALAFEVVPLDEVYADSLQSGPRPRAAITFDDAYLGAIEFAIPELHRRDLPATVFVISGAESGQTFWWDALADGYPGGLPRELRETALHSAHGREDEVRCWAAENRHPMQQLTGSFVAAAWEDIERVAELPGIAIASHTHTHANIASLEGEECMSELIKARRELAARIPGARPWLAYPYGKWSEACELACARAGFEFAVRVDGGAVCRHDDRDSKYALPRLNIPAGLSLRGFRLRAAGLIGR